MTKSFSVTKNGVALDPNLYSWNEDTKTFSTNEYGLVLDFSDWNDVTFKTGSWCILTTGYDCTFKTGPCCTFKTGCDCTFKTSSYCTFDTEHDCTFTTYSNCTFKTGNGCTFKVEEDCTFDTGYGCEFTVGDNCVIVRRDIFEIIQPEPGVAIKLNEFEVKGYKVVEKKHIIRIDGKEVELSEESFNNLKKQFSS